MTTDTGNKILELASKNGRVRPVELVRELKISQAAVQRQLKKLVENGRLVRKGTLPKIYYEAINTQAIDIAIQGMSKISNSDRDFFEKNYLYVTADGKLIPGWIGFYTWTAKVGESKRLGKLAEEYKQSRLGANSFINGNGWIEAIEKVKQTFEKIWIDGVFYSDFYSLPKFGKTRLGQMVLYGKQSQDLDIIRNTIDDVRETIWRLIKVNNIDAVAFVPHSVPRKIQFLEEMQKELNINLALVDLQKTYENVIVPQKTLSGLVEREENARKTIQVWNLEKSYKNVLLIDDALGSGATMNETAKKLKDTGVAKKVYGYAIVGSMKGFEVIREV